MNRGDRQEPIFRSVADRELFLKTLGKLAIRQIGPEIRESAQEKAERLLKQELSRLGWASGN